MVPDGTTLKCGEDSTVCRLQSTPHITRAEGPLIVSSEVMTGSLVQFAPETPATVAAEEECFQRPEMAVILRPVDQDYGGRGE